jgi:hypothetical protein
MAKVNKSIPKKRGRPKKPGGLGGNNDTVVPARLTPALIKSLDAWAARHDVSRSEAIRQLIERALQAPD